MHFNRELIYDRNCSITQNMYHCIIIFSLLSEQHAVNGNET
jgi:hypothetical protein